MSIRYPGGLINRSAPVIVGPTGGEGGSAPGVWTLEQASYYVSQGTWPKPLLPRVMWSTGANSSGQIGDNTTINRSSPVQVTGGQSWSVIGGGSNFTTAINSSGALFSWGANAQGQLGLGDNLNRSSPIQVGALTDWSNVKGAGLFAIALKTNGTIWSWGYNVEGQLGQNNSTSTSSPVQIGSLTTWANIACTSSSAAAIKTDGTLWTWGKNQFGQLGQNKATTVNVSSPVQVGSLTNWSKVFGSLGDSMMAVKTDGTVWMCGDNTVGRLGDGTVISRSSPVQIGALTTWASGAPGANASYFIKTDGTMWSCGGNAFGQLALNLTSSYTYRSSPTQIGSLTNWSSVTAGINHMGALTTSGTILSCGRSYLGAIGQNGGPVANLSSPVQIGSRTSWTAIVASSRGLSMIIKG